MTNRSAGRVQKLPALAPYALAILLGAGAVPALAQTPTTLTVSGTLVIDGGGTNAYTVKYSGVTVNAGTAVTTIRLSPAHPTLVIRGNVLFGGTCSTGADCFNTDICDAQAQVCGWTGIEVDPQCGNAAQLTALDRTLDDCVNAWRLDNPSNLVARANTCMQAGSKLYGAGAVVTAACPQLQQYRDSYDLLFTTGPGGWPGNILNKAIQKGVTVSLADSEANSALAVQRIGEMKGVLGVIDSWFRAQVARWGTANDGRLFAATSAATGLFFKSVFVDETIASQPPVGAADGARIADKIQRSGLVADRQVLSAAFGPEMPLQTAPLLLITSDALQGLAERTASFAAIQDIACRVRTCVPGRTSVGNYMKLVGSVAERDKLLAAITLAGTTPLTGDPDTRVAEWKPVFEAMAGQHAALEYAVLSARDAVTGYSAATLETDDLSAIPAYARPLASLVRPALKMSDAFERTGTFRPQPRQLVLGMDTARSEKLRAEVDRLCMDPGGVIPSALSSYRANEYQYVNAALQTAQAGNAAAKAKVQLDALFARYRDLSSDMNGLRSTKQAEEITFGGFMQNFEALLPAIVDQAQKIEVAHGNNDIDVRAVNALFNPSNGPLTDLSQVAVRRPDPVTGEANGGPILKLTRAKGDVINIGFTGKWAPTCALRNIRDPDGNRISVTDSGGGDILTGPEGYSTSRTATGSEATSKSLAAGAETWLSGRLTTETCGKVGFDIIFASASVKTCVAFEVGARAYANASYSSTSGSSTLNAFSWGTGIRSSETPFPQEPVGSLLLVELPQGRTALSDVRSVQVLTYPQASVLVGDASDFYLVVNDKQCATVSPSPLGVRVAELVNPGTLSRVLVQAMADSLKDLRTRAQDYVAQGRLLPGQRESLRGLALNKVLSAPGAPASLSVYAESLRNLFETFVNKEIANIEREIELVSLERQIRALAAEEDAIRLDITAAQANGRVASLLGGLSLRNLDLIRLEVQTGLVSDLVRDWMEPVIALRLSGNLTLTSADKVTLDRAISLSPGGKYVDNLDAACPAVRLISDKLRTDANANPSPVVRPVIISIPDPLYVGTKAPYREVDRETAARVWDSIRNGGDLEITVTPSMFYENKEPFSLQCALNSPVVLSMVYYLVQTDLVGGVTLNSETTTVFPDMLFPRQQGVLPYTFLNGLYLRPQVTILMGNDPSRSTIDPVIGEFGTYWSTPGALTLTNRGTSPFTTFHLDLSRARNTYLLPDGTLDPNYPFKNARALLLAFNVEAISQAPNNRIPGVPPCQP